MNTSFWKSMEREEEEKTAQLELSRKINSTLTECLRLIEEVSEREGADLCRTPKPSHSPVQTHSDRSRSNVRTCLGGCSDLRRLTRRLKRQQELLLWQGPKSKQHLLWIHFPNSNVCLVFAYECFGCMCIAAWCVQCPLGQKKAYKFPDCGLQMVACHHVGSGKQPWSPGRAPSAFNQLTISSSSE